MIKFLKLLVSFHLFRSFEFVSCFEFRASNLLQIEMVPRAGLEPAQSHDHEILSLARIPISPPRPPYVTGGVPRTPHTSPCRNASCAYAFRDTGVAKSRSLFVAKPP